jgi:hypothetical protein
MAACVPASYHFRTFVTTWFTRYERGASDLQQSGAAICYALLSSRPCDQIARVPVGGICFLTSGLSSAGHYAGDERVAPLCIPARQIKRGPAHLARTPF